MDFLIFPLHPTTVTVNVCDFVLTLGAVSDKVTFCVFPGFTSSLVAEKDMPAVPEIVY